MAVWPFSADATGQRCAGGVGHARYTARTSNAHGTKLPRSGTHSLSDTRRVTHSRQRRRYTRSRTFAAFQTKRTRKMRRMQSHERTNTTAQQASAQCQHYAACIPWEIPLASSSLATGENGYANIVLYVVTVRYDAACWEKAISGHRFKMRARCVETVLLFFAPH